MTENQSVIEEITIINCSEKKLKSFENLPLTSGLPPSSGFPADRTHRIADIHSFIHDPRTQSGRIPVKRLRIIRKPDSF
ncbi:hypothetical protein [Burkholderia anthina]|uniref:hypothetical protein n=1 Tax=Burkholderia anthina TaxID=179879 RepID=UPI001AA02EBE|nr:hypothetical protein [Burkholderia anthina]QTD93880.1 hypothetical protein J4G50_23895 [Burkholderia anthina]